MKKFQLIFLFLVIGSIALFSFNSFTKNQKPGDGKAKSAVIFVPVTKSDQINEGTNLLVSPPKKYLKAKPGETVSTLFTFRLHELKPAAEKQIEINLTDFSIDPKTCKPNYQEKPQISILENSFILTFEEKKGETATEIPVEITIPEGTPDGTYWIGLMSNLFIEVGNEPKSQIMSPVFVVVGDGENITCLSYDY